MKAKLLLVAGLLFLASARSEAGEWMTGCFICSEPEIGGTHCSSARLGVGWRCRTVTISSEFGGFEACQIGGGFCENPDYSGGGSGGGTGGGGTCSGAIGCPAECFSCGGSGAPRI